MVITRLRLAPLHTPFRFPVAVTGYCTRFVRCACEPYCRCCPVDLRCPPLFTLPHVLLFIPGLVVGCRVANVVRTRLLPHSYALPTRVLRGCRLLPALPRCSWIPRLVGYLPGRSQLPRLHAVYVLFVTVGPGRCVVAHVAHGLIGYAVGLRLPHVYRL